MKNYKIYFEIFGKKMKTKIVADNEREAVKMLREKIVIVKIKQDPIDYLKNIFGI